MYFVSFVVTGYLASGKCCNGTTEKQQCWRCHIFLLSRCSYNSPHFVSHFCYCCLHFFAYFCSQYILRCSPQTSADMYCIYWSNTLQARRQKVVRFVNSPPKKGFLWKQTKTLIMRPKQGNDANNFGPERFSYRQYI